MQDNRLDASCEQLLCLHCVIVCMGPLHLTLCPSRYLELSHIIKAPHHRYFSFNFQNTPIGMFFLNRRIPRQGGGGGWAVQGLPRPFSNKETEGSETQEGPSFSILFPGSLYLTRLSFLQSLGLCREDTDWWTQVKNELLTTHGRVKKNFWKC